MGTVSAGRTSISDAANFDAAKERLLCTGRRMAFIGSASSFDFEICALASLGRFCTKLAVFGLSSDSLAFFEGGGGSAVPGRDVFPCGLKGNLRAGGISCSSVSAMANEAIDGMEMADDGRGLPVALKGNFLSGGISCSKVSGKMDVADVNERAVDGRWSMGSDDSVEVCD